MESFKQLLGYIKSSFGVEENIVNTFDVNLEFIKTFHQEFNKYQEKMHEGLDFLDAEDFENKTPVSTWFKENKEHDKYIECRNNLYALVCVSQDIMGSEMLKNLHDINPDNIHEYVQNMFGGEDSPLGDMLENSPLADLFKNGELKDMLSKLMEKLKDIDLEGIMKQFQDGNFDMSQLSGLLSGLDLGGIMGGGAGGPGMTSAMNLLGGLMGGGDEEMAGLTPQQRAKVGADRRRAEYRRKIRAREKARKKGRNNRKKKRKG